MKNSKDISLSVDEINSSWAEKLGLKLLHKGNTLDRKISSKRIQKPGLRIIEKDLKLDKKKIQVLGKTEVAYLKKLSRENQKKIINKLSKSDVPCLIFSKGTATEKILQKDFKKSDVPVFKAKYDTGKLISTINDFLAEALAPKMTVHGVLLDVDRVGVLILGKSGVGKSECAIDLIIKGAKLIADDVVEIRKVSENKLIGTGPENIRFLIEVRGIGIVNIKDLFGTTSVMDKREIEMVIELDEWNSEKEYERLGIDKKTISLLDVELSHTVIPVSPGRNMASIIEVAVRNQILKKSNPLEISNLNKNLLI